MCAVRPTAFNEDGSIEFYHDEFQHGGTIKAEDIIHPKNGDGTDNENFILLTCNVIGCKGGVSLHPITGGCDGEKIPEMFHRKLGEAKYAAAITPIFGEELAAEKASILTEKIAQK